MKKKLLSLGLSTALVLSLAAVPAFANTATDSTPNNGTLTGYSSGGGQYIQISTSLSRGTGHLKMHSEIVHNNTGAYVGVPAYTDDYGVSSIEDEIDLSHWTNKFKSNHTYAMYTTHELIGTNSVCYTVTTGYYNP